jgi:hypothetical protein
MPAEDLPNPTLFTSQSRDPGFPHPPAAGAAGGGGENPRLAGEKREETGVASLTTVHGGEKRGPIVTSTPLLVSIFYTVFKKNVHATHVF